MADTQQEEQQPEPVHDTRASESEQRTETRGMSDPGERTDTKAEERDTYQDSRYLDSRGARSGSAASKSSKASKGSKSDEDKGKESSKTETKSKPEAEESKTKSETKPKPEADAKKSEISAKESNQSKQPAKTKLQGGNEAKKKTVTTKSADDKNTTQPQSKKDNTPKKSPRKTEKSATEKDEPKSETPDESKTEKSVEPKRQKSNRKPKSGTSDESKTEKSSEDGDPQQKKKKKPNSSKDEGNETSRSDSSRQREFFKLELQRLETGLRRESSRVIAPQKKAYTPYVFNTLEPYYNTYTTRFLIEMPDEVQHGNVSRKTAQGLTDPWLDLKMDRELPPVSASKPVSRQMAILKKEKELRDRKKRSAATQSSQSRKGGSTRLPKFPVVQLETKDLATRQLFYSDVPALRHELKTKYSSSAKTKVSEDYERTHQDFYRMELDKLDEVHPINRKHMTSAYFAYLQNTPGSKKAITECVRGLKSGKA